MKANLKLPTPAPDTTLKGTLNPSGRSTPGAALHRLSGRRPSGSAAACTALPGNELRLGGSRI